MTPRAMTPGIKGSLAVMTDPAKVASVNIIHSKLNCSLLHFRKRFLVVAALAFLTRLPVQCAIKGHNAHGAFAELNGLFCRHSQGNTGAYEQDRHNE
jgi:hypothetical protein